MELGNEERNESSMAATPEPLMEAEEAEMLGEDSTKEGEEVARVGPPELPPKPQEAPIMRPGANPGAGWLRIVGSYRKGVLKIVVEEFHRLGFRIAPSNVPDEHITLFWSRSFFPKLAGLKSYQKVNWLPGMNEICRKDMLGRNITLYAKRFGDEHFSFWPKSFNLPREWNSFIEEWTARPVPYILKPPLAARGEGIRLFAKLEDASEGDEYLLTKIPLAQRYIPNPLLFHGKYKMSFRFYVALTSVDPLRIYMYQDGLVRICSTPYQNGDYSNLLIHLTNYDLQVVNEANFVETMASEETECRLDGLRADWQEVKLMLSRKGHDVDRMWKDIQDLVVKSFIAAELPLTRSIKTHVKTRGTAYEVTGFDVLLDEDLKPWLLEVNHTPSLCPHTDLENDIKRHMLRDLYQLVDVEKKALTETRKRHDALLALWLPHHISPSSPSPTSEPPSSSIHNDNGDAGSNLHHHPEPSVSNRRAIADVDATSSPSPSSPPSLPVDPSIFSALSLSLPATDSATDPQTHGHSQSTRSSVSSTTAFHPPILPFPIAPNGDLLPDQFVPADVWCIVDSAAEARRTGKWDLCFPHPATSHKYLPFLMTNRTKLMALWQQHLKDDTQTSMLKTSYQQVVVD